MIKNQMRILLSIIIFCSHLFAIPQYSELPEVNLEKFYSIAKRVTEADKIEIYKSKIGRFAFYKKDKTYGFALLTGDYALFEGYRGPTSVALVFNSKGIISKCSMVRSRDTRSYVYLLVREGFLDKFKDFQINNSIKVDAISEATETCQAIQRSVQKTLEGFLPLFNSLKIDKNGVLHSTNPDFTLKKLLTQ